MNESNDPRVYFAAERTLLAWIRTGLGVIGLGFVVARFGLFLRLMRDVPHPAPNAGSTWIGVGLVVLGSTAIGLAALQHLQFSRGLKSTDLPRPNTMRWSACFAITIAVIGLALALYLLQGAGAL